MRPSPKNFLAQPNLSHCRNELPLIIRSRASHGTHVATASSNGPGRSPSPLPARAKISASISRFTRAQQMWNSEMGDAVAPSSAATGANWVARRRMKKFKAFP
jgi:hypothetical protein